MQPGALAGSSRVFGSGLAALSLSLALFFLLFSFFFFLNEGQVKNLVKAWSGVLQNRISAKSFSASPNAILVAVTRLFSSMRQARDSAKFSA